MYNAAHKRSPPASNSSVNGGRRNQKLATLGVGDTLGEGDSSLVLDVLPQDLADVAFENMRKEVAWHSMYHRGRSYYQVLMRAYEYRLVGGAVPRLVAVEGQVELDGR